MNYYSGDLAILITVACSMIADRSSWRAVLKDWVLFIGGMTSAILIIKGG
jgi:hypothetical protein